MSFDPTSALLGLTSVRGTLHIFRLTKSAKPSAESKMEQYPSPHRREMYSDDEMPNNYKKDHKGDLEDDSDEEAKNVSGGCCGGWFGCKFLFSKLSGAIVDDPSETWTAGTVLFTPSQLHHQI